VGFLQTTALSFLADSIGKALELGDGQPKQGNQEWFFQGFAATARNCEDALRAYS
jgi:hypothetical protein